MTHNALLTNTEAADYLRLSPRTLNNSRYTGLLAGVKAPPYRKMGKAVRYEQSALDNWKAQFTEQTSTSESAA
ncbi:helix-turn-helix domain-containing protein [Gilvimarinus agarilyticus]|uniref:helix-turn-helix domain-containing protein n=1 Tax=Gilvimarinus agarilyticus TaxID=679259 RepID=UPI000697AA05|nr:helix-turn-helix domain-containing protein [Gilvimarinus agarilyticus]